MFKKLKKLFYGKKILPVKDPMDWTLTESSTPWIANTYCRSCTSQTYHRERMAGICNQCGGFMNFADTSWRASRQIWNGDSWVWQHKYGDGPENYTINTCRIYEEYSL